MSSTWKQRGGKTDVPRRTVLKGISLGAVAEIAAACGGGDDNKDTSSDDGAGKVEPPAPMNELSQHVEKGLGANAATYFAQATSDPNYTSHLKTRASEFAVGDEPPNLLLPSGMALDTGGLWTNDLTLAAPVDLTGSPGFREGLSKSIGHSITDENARATFLTRRFFDPQASRTNNAPLVGHTDATMVLLRGASNSGFAVIVDREGVKQLGSIRGSKSSTNLDKTVNPRGEMVSGYIDHLTSFNSEGKRVYFPIEERSTQVKEGRVEYGGIRGVQYARAALGSPVNVAPGVRTMMPREGRDTTWDYIDDIPKSARYPHGEYVLVGGVIEITGSTGGTGPWGPATTPGTPYPCHNFDSRDACQSCCTTWQASTTATVLGATLTCAGASGWLSPVSWACYLAGAAFLGITVMAGEACRNNCRIPVKTS